MKKIFIISISAILGMFTQIDSSYAAGNCGFSSLDTSTNGTSYTGYTFLNGNAGNNESKYGLTTGSGQWAVEFGYGTVWGMAKCSSTSGNHSSQTWPESSKSNWLKTPSNTTGGNCWCQVTGFTASGNSYTSGPQCTTTASSLWVFDYDYGSSANCARNCALYCASRVRIYAEFRAGAFGAVPADPVYLNWYNNGTLMSGGPSSCTVGGTFLPPTPPARPGYIFAGWKAHTAGECGIWKLDTSGMGNAYGYANLNGTAGNKEANYGLTTGSGQWAAEFDYGTVWGMAKCSSTSGNTSNDTWPESSKSDWLKTPSDTTGGYCWCQATGFTASGNSYTSGPQCTTNVSSLWVYTYDYASYDTCAKLCGRVCGIRGQVYLRFCAAVFSVAGQ